jgi:hypothetical protein
MGGGSISGNTASGYGGYSGGVYFAGGGSFTMEGGALISQDNDVWLASGKTIIIAAPLTATPYAARITPQEYSIGTPVLDLSFVPDSYTNFTVTPKGADNWTIDSNGELQQSE